MRRIRHSKSGLFLIELMICILFFAFTAGICIQFFVKSHNMSQDAKNLYQAQQEAASMAEVLEKDIDSLDNIYIYYDKSWRQCDEKDKVYWMEVTQMQSEAEESLEKIKIAVYSGEKSQKREIYHLNLSIYVPKNDEHSTDADKANKKNVSQTTQREKGAGR